MPNVNDFIEIQRKHPNIKLYVLRSQFEPLATEESDRRFHACLAACDATLLKRTIHVYQLDSMRATKLVTSSEELADFIVTTMNKNLRRGELCRRMEA